MFKELVSIGLILMMLIPKKLLILTDADSALLIGQPIKALKTVLPSKKDLVALFIHYETNCKQTVK